MSEPLLTIKDLVVKKNKESKAIISRLNLQVASGEMIGLIGESGCGKSMTARAILNLLPGQMNAKGKILYGNRNLLSLSRQEHRKLLGKEIGIIFQDYRGSFTPFIRVGKQMVETIRAHSPLSKKEAKAVTLDVLAEMGLEAERVYKSYSFQLSGGQVQRAAIAMSLALKPSLLICDEVTTALDVMSGEKVLDYIEKMRKETGCAVLLITHDLTQAYKRTDRIYVMEQGEIVESGTPEVIRCNHQHPYTKKLCGCVLALPGEGSGVQPTREKVIFI
ncbi:ABC transporter ATP-binding protein [Sutcliffiella horikoshii]|uniref:Nickel import system ATP-binding protein NikD n=1 Tax=Sutcliffiella horikoshii TaxID=79883 RepID=A0AA94WP83_9BACI|nr:ABC transporter ATP-binding protein [Sutcliffiella horikoshii]TYS57633.1 ABC transporter ATP-binding protein [Sutcliffiella horikoshii]